MDQATVLVVDDDPTFRAYARAALEQEGYAVREAEDGEDGIELARAESIQIVLLDWRMPGLSGIRACRQLREDPAVGPVRVMMVTALDDARDRALAFEAGVDGYFIKGSDAGALTTAVRKLIGR